MAERGVSIQAWNRRAGVLTIKGKQAAVSMRYLAWDCSLASPHSYSYSASVPDMRSASGNLACAAVTTTVIEPREPTLDSDKEGIAFDRRQLESLKSAMVDTQELYERC